MSGALPRGGDFGQSWRPESTQIISFQPSTVEERAWVGGRGFCGKSQLNGATSLVHVSTLADS